MRALLGAVIGLGLAACTEQLAPKQNDAVAQVRAADAAITKAVTAKDLDGILSHYADDAVMLPTAEPLIDGKAAIREEWQAYRDRCVRRHEIDPSLEVLEEAFSWADRLASRIAAQQGSLLYANLAVRGRTARQIREQQLAPALAMQPDLATVSAGTNDVLRRRFDPAAFGADVEAMQTALVKQGAVVPAPKTPGSRQYPAIEPAPGRYVKQKA